MGKINCCSCNKELGTLSNKFSNSDYTMRKILSHHKVTIMSPDDRMCYECTKICQNDLKVRTPEEVVKNEAKKEILVQYDELKKRSPEYKNHWDKNGIIQFKNERIAILQRTWGSQVEFIVAFDDLTKEGYRLMSIDEGKEGGQSSGGFTGGVNAYFYFQKIDFVR